MVETCECSCAYGERTRRKRKLMMQKREEMADACSFQEEKG